MPDPSAVPDDISGMIKDLINGAETQNTATPPPVETPPQRPSLRDQLGFRRERAERPARKPAPAVPKGPKDEFIEPLESMYAMIGLGISAVDQPCGSVIVENATQTAQAWQELADKDPRVRKALRSLTTGSAWGGVIMAHIPILLAVTSHHAPQILPAAMRGGEQDGESTTTGSVGDSGIQRSSDAGINTNERRARFGE